MVDRLNEKREYKFFKNEDDFIDDPLFQKLIQYLELIEEQKRQGCRQLYLTSAQKKELWNNRKLRNALNNMGYDVQYRREYIEELAGIYW